jgi:hypothetical protein
MPPDVAAAIVRQHLIRHRPTTSPLPDTSQICRAAGFPFRQVRLGGAGGSTQAMISPWRGRLEIAVDPEPRGGWAAIPAGVRSDLRRHRQRFLTAHELGHSLFYDFGRGQPRRLVRDSAALETFCDAFAAALLMPPAVVSRATPTPAAILAAQKKFDVSLEVAVRAFAEQHRDRVLALLVARGGTLATQWGSCSETREVAWSDVDWLRHRNAASRTLRGAVAVGSCTRSVVARVLASRRQILVVEGSTAATAG